MIKSLETKLAWARRITWASYFLLLITLPVNSFISGTPGTLIIISLLPLVIFLPGMARENYKSLSMLCFVTLLYFIPAVVHVWEAERTPGDIVALALICVLFTATMLYSRWQQYHQAGNP